MTREALQPLYREFVDKNPALTGTVNGKEGGVSLVIVTSPRQFTTDFARAQQAVSNTAPSLTYIESQVAYIPETAVPVQLQAHTPQEILVFLGELAKARNRRNRAPER